MKKIKNSRLTIGVGLVALSLLLSCADDMVPKTVSKQAQALMAAQDNAQMIVSIQELLDMTVAALREKDMTYGRAIYSGSYGDGCKPAVNLTLRVDHNHPDSLIYTGSMHILFGTNALCNQPTHRLGGVTDQFKLLVSRKDKKAYRSYEVISMEGLSQGDGRLGGYLYVKSASGKRMTVEAKQATMTYNNGTTSTWNGTLFATGDASLKVQDRVVYSVRLTGTLKGTNQFGSPFTAQIMQDVHFKQGCSGTQTSVPVSGQVEVQLNDIRSTTNYGDGSCDRKYRVNANGSSSDHILS